MADLGTAYVNIVPKAQGIEGQIEGILGGPAEQAGTSAGQKAGSGFAAGIGQTLLGAAAAVTATVAGIGAALISGTSQVAAYADEVDKMSQKLGFSATAYQEWNAVLQHSGTSLPAVTAGIRTLTGAAADGNPAFEALGMNLEEVSSMGGEELFAAVITALQGLDNEAERTQLAMDLFGRSAMELGPLLNTSAAETEEMRQRVHELGGVLSGDAVSAGAAFQDTLQDMTTAIGGVKNGIMTQFMPAITEMMKGFTELILGSDNAVDAIASGMDSVLNTVGEVGSRVFEIAGTILPQLVAVIIDHLPQMIEGGTQLLVSLVQGLIQAMPQIITAGIAVITTLLNGISQAMPQLIPAAVALIPVILNALISAAPQLLTAGIRVITSLVSGISKSIPQLVSAATGLIPAVATAIINNLPEIVAAGIELIVQLLVGIVQAIPQLLTFVPDLFTQTVQAFAAIDWASLGKQLIDGIVSGLWSAAGSLWNAVKEIIRSALNSGKDEAETGSPSRLFARELGRWIPPGVAMGIDDNLAPLQSSVQGMIDLAAGDFARGVHTMSAVQTAMPGQAIDYDRLAAAISSRPVVIEGDTGKIFRIVRQTNLKRTRATNYNALGAMV